MCTANLLFILNLCYLPIAGLVFVCIDSTLVYSMIFLFRRCCRFFLLFFKSPRASLFFFASERRRLFSPLCTMM